MTASAPRPPLTPFVPRDFLIAPVFTATPQTKPRTLVINSVKWTIGDEHPLKRHPTPALDMRHGRAYFTLLSFRDRLRSSFFSVGSGALVAAAAVVGLRLS